MVLTVGLCGGAAGVGVSLLLVSRPADSGVPADPPPVVTCRGLLHEPGFYAGRTVRLDTVGMVPGTDPHTLAYVRVFGAAPVVVARFTKPVPVPPPRFCVGRVEVPEKGPVVVTGCRPSD